MTCVFCGSGISKTDEHVYARWMRKGIQAEARTTVTVGREERFVRTDAGPTIVLRKGVCRGCNTGWMAALERTVQPLLLPAMRGDPVAYAPESQRAIAAWATQKALLTSLAIRAWGFAAFAPTSAIRWLYEHRGEASPPPGTQVWLAAVEARLGTSDALTGSISTGWAPPSPRLPRFYFVTVSAGCLVLQVGGQDTDAARSPVTFIRPDNLLTTAPSIWPARDQLITWPPGTILTKDELTELGEWEGTQSEAVRPRGHLRHE